MEQEVNKKQKKKFSSETTTLAERERVNEQKPFSKFSQKKLFSEEISSLDLSGYARRRVYPLERSPGKRAVTCSPVIIITVAGHGISGSHHNKSSSASVKPVSVKTVDS